MSSVYSRNVFALWNRNAQLRTLLKPYRNDAFNIFPLNRSLWLIPKSWIFSRIVWKSFIFSIFLSFFELFEKWVTTKHVHASHADTLFVCIYVIGVSAIVHTVNTGRYCWPTKYTFYSTILLSRWMDTVSHIFQSSSNLFQKWSWKIERQRRRQRRQWNK